MRYERWIRICLLNLFLVAVAGLLMRYKIAWSLPWINQKNLLHAHSHFAFSGWVSLALYVMITGWLYPDGAPAKLGRLLRWQWIASLGMLFTFPFMGYAVPSIFFSTLTIAVSYAFAWQTWRALGRKGEAGQWVRLGVLANFISSFGTFALAWLMQQPGVSQKWYVLSVYFFLHFQYNGWFFFSIVGFFLASMPLEIRQRIAMNAWRSARQMLTLALLPALFLSALWLELHIVLRLLATLAALVQMMALIWMLRAIHLPHLTLTKPVQWLWGAALLALVVKMVLQLLSCLPGMSIFAFGYRPLVIAYLHLVLLGFVSLFLVGYFLYKSWIRPSWGVTLFLVAVILNEFILIIQGLSAIGYMAVPHVNEMLFVNTVFLVISTVRLQKAQQM